MLYVELDAAGVTRHVHYAPYLDYRPLGEDDPELASILDRPECAWIDRDMEKKAQSYAVARVVPEHLAEVRDARLALIAKTEAAVKDRLTKEISHWDHRAEQLKAQEQAGKTGARLNSGEARKRADNLQAPAAQAARGVAARGADLPAAAGGARRTAGSAEGAPRRDRRTRSRWHENSDRHPGIGSPRTRHRHGSRAGSLATNPSIASSRSWATTSKARVRDTGRLRFIEVKGRVSGAATVTVTRNEILY